MKSAACFVVVALCAGRLAAQHDHPAPPPGRGDTVQPRAGGMMGHMAPGGMPMGMRMEGMPMHGAAMVFAPQHLLERRDKLGLSPQQVARLEALRDATRVAHDRAATAARLAGDSLGAALGATTPDTALARRLFRAHHDAMGEAHWVMLRASAQAKALLTDAQRGRVEGWADAMQEHHMGMDPDRP
jgi:hypothetical protein